MKKCILLVCALLILCASGALAVERYEVLMPGDQDEYVKALQTVLIEKGYLKDRATGYYGTNTTKAVLRFQQRHELTADGIAGPITQKALYGKAYEPIPSTRAVEEAQDAPDDFTALKLGSEGDAVKQLQTRLTTLGYYTYAKLTSYFGPVTEAAVRAFERANGLDEDGIVDQQTHAAVFSAAAVSNLPDMAPVPAAVTPADAPAIAAPVADTPVVNAPVVGAPDADPAAAPAAVQNAVIPEPESAKAEQLITIASGLMGAPYRAAGDSPSGFDCSGYVYYCLKQMRMDIPRSSAQQAAVANWAYIQTADSLRRGDLVFFLSPSDNTRIGHVGIYLGNAQFIHSSTSKGVVVSSLASGEYQRRYCWGRRIF